MAASTFCYLLNIQDRWEVALSLSAAFVLATYDLADAAVTK